MCLKCDQPGCNADSSPQETGVVGLFTLDRSSNRIEMRTTLSISGLEDVYHWMNTHAKHTHLQRRT